MNRSILLIASLIFASCSAAPVASSSTSEPPVYRMDLDITVNGLHGIGTLVVDPAASFHIEVRAPSKPELVTVRTCSRETPLGKQDDKFSIDIAPNQKEGEGSCPITIQAYAQSFNYAGAMIEVRNESVPGRLFCNGGSEAVQGVSLCQSRVGLSQRIKLLSPVSTLKQTDQAWLKLPQATRCPALTKIDDFTYDVDLGKGLCIYELRADDTHFHRLTTFGYEEYRTGVK